MEVPSFLFREIKEEVKSAAKKVGFKIEGISFIPGSTLHYVNVAEKSEMTAWFKGETLVESLDKIKIERRSEEQKPLRVVIHQVHKIGGIGTVPVGKVVSGVFKPGMSVTFDHYLGEKPVFAEVKSIEKFRCTMEQALPGDYVGFHVASVHVRELSRGMICGEGKKEPPRRTLFFKAEIIVMNSPNGVKAGYMPQLHCHTKRVTCRIDRILSKTDKKTGKVKEEQPATLKNGERGIVLIIPLGPLCVEKFKEYPSLGRIVTRDRKTTVGVGIVKQVVRIWDELVCFYLVASVKIKLNCRIPKYLVLMIMEHYNKIHQNIK